MEALNQNQIPNPEVDNPQPPLPIHLDNPALNAAIQIINPSHQALTIKLTDSNYLLWRLQVLISARGFGLEGFLLGTFPPPAQTIPAADGQPAQLNHAFLIWQRQDQLLAAWLLASVTEDILVSLVGLNSSREIWESLEHTFASQSQAKVMQYKLQLQTLKKGALSMREYINKMKSCVDLLASAGQPLTPEDQILHLLAGLGPEYNPVLVSVTTRPQPYSLHDVKALLMTFESRLD